MADHGMSVVLAEKLRAFGAAPRRFPVPLACAVIWAAITVARTHDVEIGDRQTVELSQLFLILGLFLSLSVKLFAESRNWPIIRWLPLSAAALGLLALIVYIGPRADPFEGPLFLFLGPGLILLTIVSPFLGRGAENWLIWDFNFKSWTSAAFGLVVALVLAFGLMAVFGALKALFGIYISGNVYSDVWIICLSVIWPWQTLAGVPGGFGPQKEEYAPRWITYLISWLLVPMALVYLALLYAFAAKITIQWTLPQGQIGWLVAGFAGFGLAVWHAAHPLRETGNRLSRLYIRFFHPALAVPVGLLAVGVGARVAEYGITENRYGLILLTLWLAGIVVHGLIVRAPRLNVAPISFAVLLILASFGPWGASSVSIRSQLARLDALLIEAGVLRDGKLSAPVEPVETDLAKRISGVVDYLNTRNRSQAFTDRLAERGMALKGGFSSRDIVAALGMEYINRWGSPDYQSWTLRDPDTLDVRGFDVAVKINAGPANTVSGPVNIGGAVTVVTAAIIDNTLEISTTTHGPVVVDLATIVAALKRDGSTVYMDEANAPIMTVEARGNGLKARLHFTSIYVHSIAGFSDTRSVVFFALIGLDEER